MALSLLKDIVGDLLNSWPNERLVLQNLTHGGKYFVLDRLARVSGGPILYVTESEAISRQALRYFQSVQKLDGEPLTQVLHYPEIELLSLLDYTPPTPTEKEERNLVLELLLRGDPCVVFASAPSLFRKTVPHDSFSASLKRVVKNERLKLDDICQWAEKFGYARVSLVTQRGEFARRGGIFDIYPVLYDYPIRFDLLGDLVETISTFDPTTQRSKEQVDSVLLVPVDPLGIGPESIVSAVWKAFQRYRETVEPVSQSSLDRLESIIGEDLERIKLGESPVRRGFYEETALSTDCDLLQFFPPDLTMVFDEPGLIQSAVQNQLRFLESRFSSWRENGLSFTSLSSHSSLSQGRFLEFLIQSETSWKSLYLFALTNDLNNLRTRANVEIVDAGFAPLRSVVWGASTLFDRLREESLGFSNNDSGEDVSPPGSDGGRCQTLIISQYSARLSDRARQERVPALIKQGVLPSGFVVPQGVRVISDFELFGEVEEVSYFARRSGAWSKIGSKDELNIGDYIVHIDHGVGRYTGIIERRAEGVSRPYVEIQYAGKEKLFVPVDQLSRLRPYRYDGPSPPLNSIGSRSWQKTKERVRKDSLEIARRLFKLYLKRDLIEGKQFGRDSAWQLEFEDAFPYQMTPDQERAWEEVKADMESGKPMDRLICGDVGFGKTEIAMRAAFKAVSDGSQAVLIAPSTVLADQHLLTFRRRFRPFPFVIELVSRFRARSEMDKVLRDINAGKVDIAIGTHRLLSKDVKFKNLGLLIIDEEQRFGVGQKERLREQYPKVDVLTLTATPIPRTLHMSLIRLRDISLVETAPQYRLPVKTYVGEYDARLIKEVVLREMGRNGQIYFLHNRIEDIRKVELSLSALVPEARIVISHGRLPEMELERRMHNFSMGAYDILLATTIIENGLDIPRVNTLIVDDTERLGLAQMHQLRGRVGRSDIQAYAYFFHSPERLIGERERRRLHSIYNYAYLGAGYDIADADLRMRGAGTILGEMQHGRIASVGVDYYLEILGNAIEEQKRRVLAEEGGVGIEELEIEEIPSPEELRGTSIEIPISVGIPAYYVDDPVLRLDILRSIASLTTQEEVREKNRELRDRFGEVPKELVNLLDILSVKIHAEEIGLTSISYNRLNNRFEIAYPEEMDGAFSRITLLDKKVADVGGGRMDWAALLDDHLFHNIHRLLERLEKVKTAN